MPIQSDRGFGPDEQIFHHECCKNTNGDIGEPLQHCLGQRQLLQHDEGNDPWDRRDDHAADNDIQDMGMDVHLSVNTPIVAVIIVAAMTAICDGTHQDERYIRTAIHSTSSSRCLSLEACILCS